MKDIITFYKENRVGFINLNRPPANGYDLEFLETLIQVITSIKSDKEVKVVVITSILPKFFCGGADIKVFASNSIDDNKAMVIAARKVTELITSSNKIFISAIQGHALGGGLELAMACDLRIAARGKYLLGLPEIKLGLIPGNGGTIRLIHLIGASKAMELLLTGDSISPEVAFQYGLINQIFSEDDFESHVAAYAEKLAKGPGKAMTLTKKFCNDSRRLTLEEGLILEKEYVDSLYTTDDAKEGFDAFIEKRPAQFD